MARPARTLGLVTAQLGGILAITLAGGSWRPPGGAGIPALAIAGVFMLSGLTVFHLEFRQEAHTFTFAEIPLVLALFFAGPGDLLVGRLLGEALALVFHPRQPPLKVLVNLANFLTECAVALAVFHVVFGGPPIDRPSGWIAAFAAVTIADLVSVMTIGFVIAWHGGQPNVTWVAIAAIASACANSSLGIIAALLIEVHSAALIVLAVVAVVLLVAYRGYARLAERYASLQVLHDFTEAIGGALRPGDVIEAMLHHARKLLRADVAELVVLGDGGARVRTRLAGDAAAERWQLTDEAAACLAALPPGQGAVRPRGEAVPEAVAAYAEALDAGDFLVTQLDVPEVSCTLSVAGRLTGVSTFDAEDARLFTTLANHAAMALEKGRLIDKLQIEANRREHQALHDDLTGLPNRLQLNEVCKRRLAERGNHATAVVLMDLDHFKDVNDTLGHQTGDELLTEVGRRLEATVRDGDLVARLGGDEYAILLMADDPSGATAEAQRVLAALQEAIVLQGIEVELRVSAGIALAPQHGTDPHALLQHADVAMYTAKRIGSGVEVYSSESDHHSPRRLQLASELRRAVRDDELVAYFQPKAELRSGRIVGAEALVRWHHPMLGQVMPDEFITIAEQSGLIEELTTSVMRQALSACRRWRDSGHDVGVAVNVAARTLQHTGLIDDVAGLLARADLPARALTLEITESSIMTDTTRAHGMLEDLSALGVRLSVDDFGTGYSSLAYLQQLPVHELKVDKSFVFQMSDDDGARAIVRSVVQLGHSLGLTVVAEGVENQLAWDRLREMGCDIAQGYILSRPIPARDMLEWLDRRRRFDSEADTGDHVRRPGGLRSVAGEEPKATA